MARITPEELIASPFTLIGKEWLLLAAEKEGKVNAMTCSWGGMGVLWGKNVAFIFVRHSRYTLEFLEAADGFSLSWFDDPGHKMLGYLGSVSGREEDKLAKAGLVADLSQGAPCFDSAKRTMICRKLYTQEVLPERFCDKTILASCYKDSDYHRMYVGEILSIEQEQ
ncbi:MAG: flavin reductase family protein [Angelakisella sp.]